MLQPAERPSDQLLVRPAVVTRKLGPTPRVPCGFRGLLPATTTKRDPVTISPLAGYSAVFAAADHSKGGWVDSRPLR